MIQINYNKYYPKFKNIFLKKKIIPYILCCYPKICFNKK